MERCFAVEKHTRGRAKFRGEFDSRRDGSLARSARFGSALFSTHTLHPPGPSYRRRRRWWPRLDSPSLSRSSPSIPPSESLGIRTSNSTVVSRRLSWWDTSVKSPRPVPLAARALLTFVTLAVSLTAFFGFLLTKKKKLFVVLRF